MVLRSPAVCAGWATQPAQSCPEVRPSFQFWANTPNSRPFPQVSTLRIWSKPSRSCCPDERLCCKANFGVCWPIKHCCRHTVTTKPPSQLNNATNLQTSSRKSIVFHSSTEPTVWQWTTPTKIHSNRSKSTSTHYNINIYENPSEIHQFFQSKSIKTNLKPAAADSGSAGGLPGGTGLAWQGKNGLARLEVGPTHFSIEKPIEN